MPHFCAAIKCGNCSSRNGDISFFRFPSDVKRCRKWVTNTRRTDLDDKTPDQLRKNYVLCSSHFEDSQFANVLHKRLNWNAVPTLFDVPNPPTKFSCKRNAPLRRTMEIASAHDAIQDATSRDVPSLDLSVDIECENTCSATTIETCSNVEKWNAAPLLKVSQLPSLPFEIDSHDETVNKRKTECVITAAATSETLCNVEKQTAALLLKVDQLPSTPSEIVPHSATVKRKNECVTTVADTHTVSRVADATAPFLNVKRQLLVPATIRATQTPVIRIIKLVPKISQLPSQLNKINYRNVIFKTAVVSTQPTRLIRPVQAIVAAPSTSKAMPGITAVQGSHPMNSSLRTVCQPFNQTAVTSTRTGSVVKETAANIQSTTQRVSMSRLTKPPETPVEKKQKQKIHQLYSQLWRKNRKIEALKRKVSEKLSDSKRPHRSVEAILEAAKRFLTPVQLSLLRAQLLNSQKEKNGYRWSTSDKIFGLQLMYKSSAAFRFVSQHLALPSEITLRRFVAETLGSQDSEKVTAETSIPPADLEREDSQPENEQV